jgi:hypothetical protein
MHVACFAAGGCALAARDGVAAMIAEEIEALRQRLPPARAARALRPFCSNGVHVLQTIPLDEMTPELFDDFAIADTQTIRARSRADADRAA